MVKLPLWITFYSGLGGNRTRVLRSSLKKSTLPVREATALCQGKAVDPALLKFLAKGKFYAAGLYYTRTLHSQRRKEGMCLKILRQGDIAFDDIG